MAFVADPCQWASDGQCDVPGACEAGDYADCSAPSIALDPPPEPGSSQLVSSIDLGAGCTFSCSDRVAVGGGIAIDCVFRYLPGALPREIGLLICRENVTQVNLIGNSYTGTIPDEWRSLTRLKVLNIQSSQLYGQLPTWLGDFAELQSLDLSGNRIDGTIPTSIGSLKRLTNLDLSSNLLTGTLPSSLGQLTNLKCLVLTNNQLNGSLPESLGNIGALWTFEVSSNLLTGCTDRTARGPDC
jgi:Leucine-rich repeat (LRR) protein